MTKKMRSVGVLAVLLVPTLVLLASFLIGLLESENAPDLVIPIAGYDPVDPIRGHYLQFRFNWPISPDSVGEHCPGPPAQCRFCATAGAKGHIASLAPAAKALSCPYEISFDEIGRWKPKRFYVPEHHGAILDKIFAENPRRFAMRAKIVKGRAIPRELLIDGRPYRDVIENR